MIKIKAKGNWRDLNGLMKSYGARVRLVQNRIAKDMAMEFLRVLKDKAPQDPQYKPYLQSLKVVGLEGKGVMAYAVVSDRDAVRLGNIDKKTKRNTVVYVNEKAGASIPALLDVLIQHNPWTIDMLPNFVNPKATMLIHRQVTEAEASVTRDRLQKLISENRSEFAKLGIRWDTIEEGEVSAEEMESLPDYMSDALRAEFGVMAKSRPHWRPTMRYIIGRIEEIIDDDKMIHGALYEALFREHTLALKEKEIWDTKKFKKETDQFQKAVVG